MTEIRIYTIFRTKKSKHYFRIINDLKLPSKIFSAFLFTICNIHVQDIIAYLQLYVKNLKKKLYKKKDVRLNMHNDISLDKIII